MNKSLAIVFFINKGERMMKIMSSGNDVNVEFASLEAELLIATEDAVVANKIDFERALSKLRSLSKENPVKELLKNFPVFVVDEQDVVEHSGQGVVYNHSHLMIIVQILLKELSESDKDDFIVNYSYDACQLN